MPGHRKLCGQILGPDDTQKVAGKSFIKKNGWRKLAMAFRELRFMAPSDPFASLCEIASVSVLF
jgi:hypothetical protein